MELWEMGLIALSLLLCSGFAACYILLVLRDGKRGAILYTLPYRILRWLGVGGKFWGPVPRKL